jgi:hypothetical protein
MRKLPECDTCTLYTQYGCRLYPSGPTGSTCLDCRPTVPEECGSYLGQFIEPFPALSQNELLTLLDQHPLFTGHCPRCSKAMAQTDPPRIHWDCECGWVDDSI